MLKSHKNIFLQAVLAAKDIELEQYKSLVQELKQQVTGLQLNTDKTSLAMLQQVHLILYTYTCITSFIVIWLFLIGAHEPPVMFTVNYACETNY